MSDFDLEAALADLDGEAPQREATPTDQARRWVLEAEDVGQLKAAARAATNQVAATDPAGLFELGAAVEQRERELQAEARAAEEADQAERSQRYRDA